MMGFGRIDGTSALLAPTWGSLAGGSFDDQSRGSNMLDGGAHMYGCYETKDGKYISIGSLFVLNHPFQYESHDSGSVLD